MTHAWSAVTALWALALTLAVAGYCIGLGRVPPASIVLTMLLLVPLAPGILRFPIVRALGVDGGPLAALTAAVVTVGVLAGYWAWLGWLSWRVGACGSRRAFAVLAVVLGLSSPFWLVAVAWMAGV